VRNKEEKRSERGRGIITNPFDPSHARNTKQKLGYLVEQTSQDIPVNERTAVAACSAWGEHPPTRTGKRGRRIGGDVGGRYSR